MPNVATESRTNVGESSNVPPASSYQPSGNAGNVSSGSSAGVQAQNSLTTGSSMSGLGAQPLSGSNHLEIPSSNNPNLLSPDVLNQRRGKYNLQEENRRFRLSLHFLLRFCDE